MVRRICRHIVPITVLAVALICLAGTAVRAQRQLMPPVFDTLGLGSVRIFPRVELGYQNMGVNFSMPANLATGSLLVSYPVVGTSHIDLNLKNAGVWVGAVNFDVATTAFPFGIFVGAGGSVQQNVNAVTTEFPGFENIGLSGTGRVDCPCLAILGGRGRALGSHHGTLVFQCRFEKRRGDS